MKGLKEEEQRNLQHQQEDSNDASTKKRKRNMKRNAGSDTPMKTKKKKKGGSVDVNDGEEKVTAEHVNGVGDDGEKKVTAEHVNGKSDGIPGVAAVADDDTGKQSKEDSETTNKGCTPKKIRKKKTQRSTKKKPLVLTKNSDKGKKPLVLAKNNDKGNKVKKVKAKHVKGRGDDGGVKVTAEHVNGAGNELPGVAEDGDTCDNDDTGKQFTTNGNFADKTNTHKQSSPSFRNDYEDDCETSERKFQKKEQLAFGNNKFEGNRGSWQRNNRGGYRGGWSRGGWSRGGWSRGGWSRGRGGRGSGRGFADRFQGDSKSSSCNMIPIAGQDNGNTEMPDKEKKQTVSMLRPAWLIEGQKAREREGQNYQQKMPFTKPQGPRGKPSWVTRNNEPRQTLNTARRPAPVKQQPSWMAKKNDERQQPAAVGGLQGKRIVFGDD